MGCFFSSPDGSGVPSNGQGQQQKTYSWDQRERKSAEHYQFKDLQSTSAAKLTGDVTNEQFNIDNCKDCTLFVVDQLSAVFIDDCTNCTIFIGPVRSSIFVRNCKDCNIIALCQQFRTRDCVRISSALYCQTLPIIESSSDMSFHCFRGNYFALKGQLAAANCSEYTNNWAKIHDFTPSKESPNYSAHTNSPQWLDGFIGKLNTAAPSLAFSLDSCEATVPITLTPGSSPKATSYFVVVFPPHEKHLRKLTRRIHEHSKDLSLMQTRQAPLTKEKAMSTFHSATIRDYADTCNGTGNVTSFEIHGETAHSVISSFIDEMGWEYVYTTDTAESKSACLDDMKAFYQHTDAVRSV